ncbi:MAG: phospholipase D family protein [Myxococcales bacterium]|nr:phospholipase D family protein [Myxococcales bacterium]
MPARPVALELIGGRGHYQRVIAAVLAAETSVWIATANLKELMIEDHRAAPGRRRQLGRASYRSIMAALAELAAKGVELRVLHADRPSRPFVAGRAQHPGLAAGLALRQCPRVHWKIVVVDGALLYLGSANWTGAGLGARGSGRRNFELGVVTDDGPLLDQVQGLYEHVWTGGECADCKLRALCPRPLDLVRPAPAPVAPSPKSAPPAPPRPSPKSAPPASSSSPRSSPKRAQTATRRSRPARGRG